MKGRAICSIVALCGHREGEECGYYGGDKAQPLDKEVFNAIRQASFPVAQENESACPVHAQKAMECSSSLKNGCTWNSSLPVPFPF